MQTIQLISRLSTVALLVYTLLHWRGFVLLPLRLLRWMVVFLAASEVVSYVSFRIMPNNLLLFAVYTIGEMFFVLQIFTTLRFTPILQKVYYALFAALSLYMLWAVFSSPAYPTQARLWQISLLIVMTIVALLQWVKLGVFNVWHFSIIMAFNARFLFAMLSNLGFAFGPKELNKTFYILEGMMSVGSNLLLFIAMYFYLNQHKLYEIKS